MGRLDKLIVVIVLIIAMRVYLDSPICTHYIQRTRTLLLRISELTDKFFDSEPKLLAFQNSIPTTDFMSTLLSYLREVDWVRHSSCSFALSCEQEPTVINDEDFVIPKLGSHFHLQNIFSERFPQTYVIHSVRER
jgi:hypothetical protein